MEGGKRGRAEGGWRVKRRVRERMGRERMGRERMGRERMGREKEAGRPTHGDAVVAREPDSYKLPHKEAKSCWEDRGWGRERGQGQDTEEKWGVKRENKKGGEEEGREGKSLK